MYRKRNILLYNAKLIVITSNGIEDGEGGERERERETPTSAFVT
jgi:hypothetical protein